MLRTDDRSPVRIWLAGLLFVLITLLLPRFAEASQPVIVEGREPEILALFDPYALGDELAPGWTLHSFQIDVATIHVWLSGPDREFAQVSLDHPDYAPDGAQRLPGFGLVIVAQPEASEAAVAELIATLERNDRGEFWAVKRSFAEVERPPPSRGASLVYSWLTDGLVLLAAFTLVLVVFVVHTVRDTPAWMKASLVAIVLVGAVVRLTLSPRVALEAWPYSRFMLMGRQIFRGPGLAVVHPDPVWASETITTTTLAFALLAAPAIYVHARYLLDDRRAALIAAGLLAVLPMHVRFSASDVSYIPSITLSAMLFTLTYMATRERSATLGWFAALTIGLPLAAVYLLRPLNIMHFTLLLTVPWVNQGIDTDKLAPQWRRVGVAFTIMTLVTVFGGIPWLLEDFGQQVREGLSVETLKSAVEVLFSPRMNALLNPTFTPPGVLALAVLGGVDLWRRGKRRLFGFLLVWLLAGLIAHAYVVPRSPYMQARYHLHLIVPFVMLAACGAEAGLRWLAARRAEAAWLAGSRYHVVIAVAVAYLCASPLLHRRFIQHIELNDTREWVFVHSLREQIPEGCHVIEYGGSKAGLRFERVGAFVRAGTTQSRWTVHELTAPGPGEPEVDDEVRALLVDPPECLYWYEGLPCFGQKPADSQKAPACDAIEGFVRLEEVAQTEFESAPYDENLATGLEDDERIRLTLFRVVPR